MRDYSHIDDYIDSLVQDVYAQTPDREHMINTRNVIYQYVVGLGDCHSVLDIGCGQGMAAQVFMDIGVEYTGIGMGNDVQVCQERGLCVTEMDMSFMTFPDDSFDLLFARHVLEHSPMPLLTLMEWHRVSRQHLLLVLPDPKDYGFVGRNHYSVMTRPQARWMLRRAGWKITSAEFIDKEYRFMCVKMPIIGYEGYAQIPLSNSIYEEERDG
jgi:SAM-dependent methyltransferase